MERLSLQCTKCVWILCCHSGLQDYSIPLNREKLRPEFTPGNSFFSISPRGKPFGVCDHEVVKRKGRFGRGWPAWPMTLATRWTLANIKGKQAGPNVPNFQGTKRSCWEYEVENISWNSFEAFLLLIQEVGRAL